VRILIVSATAMELAPLVAALDGVEEPKPRTRRYRRGGQELDVLVTGVGMIATAVWSSRALTETPYDVALNLGMCGAFDRSLVPGTVVHVVTERIAELGAEDGDGFLTLQALQLGDDNVFPFTDGRLVNAAPPPIAALATLRAVDAITVNTAHGNDESIARVQARCRPQVESMEGAAFMYACLTHGVAFAEVRAVSNVVERRNRGAWKLSEAVSALGSTGLSILDSL
jgi:futalosine hydrolase